MKSGIEGVVWPAYSICCTWLDIVNDFIHLLSDGVLGSFTSELRSVCFVYVAADLGAQTRQGRHLFTYKPGRECIKIEEVNWLWGGKQLYWMSPIYGAAVKRSIALMWITAVPPGQAWPCPVTSPPAVGLPPSLSLSLHISTRPSVLHALLHVHPRTKTCKCCWLQWHTFITCPVLYDVTVYRTITMVWDTLHCCLQMNHTDKAADLQEKILLVHFFILFQRNATVALPTLNLSVETHLSFCGHRLACNTYLQTPKYV